MDAAVGQRKRVSPNAARHDTQAGDTVLRITQWFLPLGRR